MKFNINRDLSDKTFPNSLKVIWFEYLAFTSRDVKPTTLVNNSLSKPIILFVRCFVSCSNSKTFHTYYNDSINTRHCYSVHFSNSKKSESESDCARPTHTGIFMSHQHQNCKLLFNVFKWNEQKKNDCIRHVSSGLNCHYLKWQSACGHTDF